MSFVSLYRKWRSPGVMEERLAEIEEKIKRLSEFTWR